MTRLEQLTALRARVIAATGADRELDKDLYCTLVAVRAVFPFPHYTASIDAALALIERVLPGASWGVNTAMEGGFAADVPFQKLKDMQPHPVRHRTAPLAILAALLSALITKEADHAE